MYALMTILQCSVQRLLSGCEALVTVLLDLSTTLASGDGAGVKLRPTCARIGMVYYSEDLRVALFQLFFFPGLTTGARGHNNN